MEQTKALQGLLEAADLTKMVEEISRPGSLEELSTSALAGLRLTLAHIRSQILTSHDVLASRLIQDTPRRGDAADVSAGTTEAPVNGPPRLSRQNLRASLERIIEG